MSEDTRTEQAKKIHEEIEKILADAPTIEGYTVKQLAEEIGAPWLPRYNLEILRTREQNYSLILPRNRKIYAIKKEKQ